MKPQPNALRMSVVRPSAMPLTRAVAGSLCLAAVVSANLLLMGSSPAAIATTSIVAAVAFAAFSLVGR